MWIHGGVKRGTGERRQALVFQEFTFRPILNGRLRLIFEGRGQGSTSSGGDGLLICLRRLWLAAHVHNVVPESSEGGSSLFLAGIFSRTPDGPGSDPQMAQISADVF